MNKLKCTLFVSNIPSFYKIRLFNEIAKKKKITVLWLQNGQQNRNPDFYDEKTLFHSGIWNELSLFEKIHMLANIVFGGKYKIIIGGWDSIVYWFFAFLSPKCNNSLICESSYLESSAHGIKKGLKKIFLKRIGLVYVPGKSNAELLKKLKFDGEIIITHGVGLYRRIQNPPFQMKNIITNFLYVGRLSPEKNIAFLIQVFNKFPNLRLTIAGFGPLEKDLKQIAGENIHFIGGIDNRKLPDVYQQHDVFILCSTSEPWGMVVEEAMNNGLPVIVSDKVGCAEEIVKDGENGFVVPVNDEASLIKTINLICKTDIYNRLRKNVCSTDYGEIENLQINAYLNKCK